MDPGIPSQDPGLGYERLSSWQGSGRQPCSLCTGRQVWVVARLRLANVKATMMELHEDHAGEDPEEKLARVIREDKVDQYAMFWPWGGTRSGLDVEIGWLLKSIRVGEVDSDNVAVFYEWNPEGRRAADIVTGKDGTGAFQSLEDHRRTTYYESLVARGAVPIAWSTYEDLLEFMVEFGRSLPP